MADFGLMNFEEALTEDSETELPDLCQDCS
jgi:hypothetical protein